MNAYGIHQAEPGAEKRFFIEKRLLKRIELVRAQLVLLNV